MSRGPAGSAGRGPSGSAGRRPGGRTVSGGANGGGNAPGCLEKLLGASAVVVALVLSAACQPHAAPRPYESPRPLQTARQSAP